MKGRTINTANVNNKWQHYMYHKWIKYLPPWQGVKVKTYSKNWTRHIIQINSINKKSPDISCFIVKGSSRPCPSSHRSCSKPSPTSKGGQKVFPSGVHHPDFPLSNCFLKKSFTSTPLNPLQRITRVSDHENKSVEFESRKKSNPFVFSFTPLYANILKERSEDTFVLEPYLFLA